MSNDSCCRVTCLAFATVMSLSGCQMFYTGYTAAPMNLSRENTAFDTIQKKLTDKVKDIKDCYSDQYRPGASNKEFCAGQRNQAMSMLMAESGELCVLHLSEIYGKDASINIATGSIATLASGLAAVSPASRAKSLSALSAFASGERSLINEVVYRNLLTTAIATKIREERGTRGTALLAKMNQPYDNYRIEAAVNEVLQFHEACAFHRGLEMALAEGTNTNPASKRRDLETRAQALANQIDTRAGFLGIDIAGKQKFLDAKASTSAIGDPVLRGLVDQYQAMMQQILADSAAALPPAAQKKSSDGSGGALEDPLRVSAPDLMAALEGAILSVSGAPGKIASAIANDESWSDKKLPKAYVDGTSDKLKPLGDAFRDAMYKALLPDQASAGANTITKELANFSKVQLDYTVARAPLDLNTIAGQQKELDILVPVSKQTLVLKGLAAKIAKCEKVALDLLNTFKAPEMVLLKAKTDAERAALAGPLSTTFPTWPTTSPLPCLQ